MGAWYSVVRRARSNSTSGIWWRWWMPTTQPQRVIKVTGDNCIAADLYTTRLQRPGGSDDKLPVKEKRCGQQWGTWAVRVRTFWSWKPNPNGMWKVYSFTSWTPGDNSEFPPLDGIGDYVFEALVFWPKYARHISRHILREKMLFRSQQQVLARHFASLCHSYSTMAA